MLKSNSRKSVMVICILSCLIVGAAYLHLTNGVFDLTVMEVVKTLFGLETNEKFRLVIFDFRMPRVVIAILVGIGLGMAGVVLQGITRNGLADPGILGINAGAGAAVVIFMFFFQVRLMDADISSWVSIMMMPIFGLVGGTLAAALIFSFALKNGHFDMQRLILTGIAINSGFGAVSMFVIFPSVIMTFNSLKIVVFS